MYIVHPPSLLKACRSVGSQAELARRIGVSRGRVNNWLNRGDKIPYDCVLAIEAATNGQISRHHLASEHSASSYRDSNLPLHQPPLKNIHHRLSLLEKQIFQKFQQIEKYLASLVNTLPTETE